MINKPVVYAYLHREFMCGENKQKCINELHCYELNRIKPLKERALVTQEIRWYHGYNFRPCMKNIRGFFIKERNIL